LTSTRLCEWYARVSVSLLLAHGVYTVRTRGTRVWLLVWYFSYLFDFFFRIWENQLYQYQGSATFWTTRAIFFFQMFIKGHIKKYFYIWYILIIVLLLYLIISHKKIWVYKIRMLLEKIAFKKKFNFLTN
jgi:ABC-type branched-subunit amino acid transport system permease subunit